MRQMFSAVCLLAKPKTKRRAYSEAIEAMPAALVPKQVEVASAEDTTLQLVCQAIMTGDWSRLSGTVNKAVQEELPVIGQVVLRGGRIVMPESLRKQTIVVAHKGQQGVVRTKVRLREKVWWPGMDKQVEEMRACHPCQLIEPRAKPEPVKSTRLPG